jgi:hypothetical protein
MKKTLTVFCSLIFIFVLAGATLAVEPLKQDSNNTQKVKEDVNSNKSNKSMDMIGPLQKNKNDAKAISQKGAQKVQAGDNIGTKGSDNMEQGMAGEQKGMGQ